MKMVLGPGAVQAFTRARQLPQQGRQSWGSRVEPWPCQDDPDRVHVGGRVNHCLAALTPPALATCPGYSAPAALSASSGGAMGRWAWVPSLCPLPRPCPFLLLLLLLVVPRGAQPQAGRVSNDPLPHNVANSGFLGRGQREEMAPE